MNSAVYRGDVRHRRFAPRAHAFQHSLYMLWLDLDELDEVFAKRWLWSVGSSNLMSWRREDYFGRPERPLIECVRDAVEAELGERPTGPVRQLTHLRAFGYAFNPVSFYYCYEPDGTTLHSVLSEITNTPWGERHSYIVRADASGWARSQFAKRFHVSPFMPMQQRYRWALGTPGERLAVHMENEQEGEVVFDATLTLERRELSGAQLARCLLRHPWITAKVVVAIHAHAALLWLKRVPFIPHPRVVSRPRQGDST